jgi:hypothetical protein
MAPARVPPRQPQHRLAPRQDETDTVVSITITGDLFCYATNVDTRLDTPQARALLDDFVTLP